MSSLPSNQPTPTSATPAAAAADITASEPFDDDNDYDKLNDEDWQDMPAASQSKQSSLSASSSSTSGAAGTPLSLRTEPPAAAGGGSSGSQTPVHSASASDTLLRLHLDDHSHADRPSSPSSAQATTTGGPDSPPIPDSASSSSSEFSLLNPSVASSVCRSHRNSVTALSTTSDQQPSPSMMSRTPTSTSTVEAASTPSPPLDQPTSAEEEEEGISSTLIAEGLQQDSEAPASQPAESTPSASSSAPTVAHPAAVHATPLPLWAAAGLDSDADTAPFKQSQTSGAIASPSNSSTATTESSPQHPSGDASPSLEGHVMETGKENSSEEHEKEQSSTAIDSQSTEPPGAPSSVRTYRTTVEDAVESDEMKEEEEEEDEGRANVGSESGLRWRRRDVPQGTLAPTAAEALGQYAMPGSLNLELENLGLESHFAAQSRPSAPSQPHMEDRQCRICLGGPDEAELGRLISPCMCKGSMKYVHVECLNEWRTRSPKRESHYKCDTCKYEFSFRRTSFAKYLSHPATLFILTILAFALAVFAAGFVMKLLMYLFMEEFDFTLDPEEGLDADKVIQMTEDKIVFRPPDSLRAVFRIDSTHMVFGSLLVSIVGFLQLLVSAILMGGGGHVFQIGGFGLGGRRRGGRGARQGEAGISSFIIVLVLVFGLFKSLYVTYRFVRGQTRKALAKAESMILEVQ
ncbi:hypothetical protein BGZ73_009070 [Actinomortierella ambigua]|nr:hypothetical protein BGZ73_009070 [Actinomortierella ambigua]